MPDELTQGQPVAEPSPAPVESAPAQAAPAAPDIPEKLAGKTAEEIASQYLELEKKLGEQGRELGELRARIPQYQPPMPQWVPPPQPEPKFEFDYANPEASIDRMVERKWEERERQRSFMESQTREQEAQYSYNMGKDSAFKSGSKLYEGIEPLVEQGVQLAYRQYGLPVSALRDPRTFERVAVNIRHERGELDKVYAKAAPQPPAPSHTAIPNQTRPEARVGVELSDEDRRWAKDNGYSEQEAREIIEREREFGGGR